MNILPLDNPADRTLGRILMLQAQAIPKAPCYLVDDRTYTFDEVNRTVNRYAAGLKKLGVKKDDRVIIFMRSCVEFIMLAFATNKLGAVWVPINGDYKGEWLKEAIEDSKGKILITDTDKYPRIEEVLQTKNNQALLVKINEGGSLPDGAVDLASFNALSDAEPETVAIDYGDTCAILWTSAQQENPKV